LSYFHDIYRFFFFSKFNTGPAVGQNIFWGHYYLMKEEGFALPKIWGFKYVVLAASAIISCFDIIFCGISSDLGSSILCKTSLS